MACSRSQHGSSTRPSWVTAVSSTAMPLAWAARRSSSSHGTSSRNRSAPELGNRAASAASPSSGPDTSTATPAISAAARSDSTSSGGVAGPVRTTTRSTGR